MTLQNSPEFNGTNDSVQPEGVDRSIPETPWQRAMRHSRLLYPAFFAEKETEPRTVDDAAGTAD